MASACLSASGRSRRRFPRRSRRRIPLWGSARGVQWAVVSRGGVGRASGHFWLHFWLQLARFDLGSRSFAVVRQSGERPAQQAFSNIGERWRTPSGRPGSVGVRGSSPLSSTTTTGRSLSGRTACVVSRPRSPSARPLLSRRVRRARATETHGRTSLPGCGGIRGDPSRATGPGPRCPARVPTRRGRTPGAERGPLTQRRARRP